MAPGKVPFARSAAAIAAVLFVALAGACEEDGASSKSTAAAEEKPEDSIVAAWKTAGLEATSFEPMAGAGIASGTCVAGQVNQMDTVLCRYADDAAAEAAKPAGLTYIGETTGVALSKGPYLFVIADRNKKDPSGKTIDKAAKTFLAYEHQAAGAGKAEAAGDKAGDKADKKVDTAEKSAQ